jgi:hypothetical protein
MVLKCDCNHEFQDAEHGPKRRVHTPLAGGYGKGRWACTVCGKVRDK